MRRRRPTHLAPPAHATSQDWKRHNLVCRADAAATEVAALPPPAYSEEEDFNINLRRAAGVLLPPLHPGVWWEFIPLPSQTAGFGDGWKVVYSIDMGVARSPGVPRRVSATSMGPGQLKHIRYHLNPSGPFASESQLCVQFGYTLEIGLR